MEAHPENGSRAHKEDLGEDTGAHVVRSSEQKELNLLAGVV